MEGGHIGDTIGLTILRTEKMWGATFCKAQPEVRTGKLEAPSQQESSPRAEASVP